jgi:thymidylate synthase|tara:strand:+ start:92 stop:886 length:795 start_codon:yes stop_codon:yes gene_type:complete
MSNTIDYKYLEIASRILTQGHSRKSRNGIIKSLPFQTLEFNIEKHFPLLKSRKIYYKGIAGEYAAMIRGPKHVDDFTRWGCNYWNQWAEEDGSINIDYGNAWINFNGVNQMANVLDSLLFDPADRRMVISGWNPGNLEDLSLPCCHHNYQFWTDGKVVDMLWIQRSGDFMVGIPSDMVFASIMLACFANNAALKPRNIKMVIGDAHIYEEHYDNALKQINSVFYEHTPATYSLAPQADLYSFVPDDLHIDTYEHNKGIKYELKK